MRRDKLLDRLAKLAALESSPNPHEAESARRQTERFMARHGLSRDDIRPREVGYHEADLPRGWDASWKFALATAAARHYGVEAVRRGPRVRICGEHADVEAAFAFARRLLRTVRELEAVAADMLGSELGIDVSRLDETLPRRQRDLAFRLGAARGIGRALARAREGGSGDAWCSASSGEETAAAKSVPRELARRPGSGKDHSVRVAARYRPEVVALPDDGIDASWEAFGKYVADRCVVARVDGVVEVKKFRKP